MDNITKKYVRFVDKDMIKTQRGGMGQYTAHLFGMMKGTYAPLLAHTARLRTSIENNTQITTSIKNELIGIVDLISAIHNQTLLADNNNPYHYVLTDIEKRLTTIEMKLITLNQM